MAHIASVDALTTQRFRIVPLGRLLGLWTLAGLLLAAQAWLSFAMRGEAIAWTRSLAIWLTWAWLWALLTPLAFALAARLPFTRPLRMRVLLVHVVAGVGLAGLNLAAFAAFAPWVGAISEQPTWLATFVRLTGTTLLLNVPVYWLLIAVAHGMRSAAETRARERRTLQLEAQLADARLEALRAQLRPHFLFNAMNTVAVLMHEDVPTAERVLLRLSELLRASLGEDGATEIALRDELAFVEAYLAIEQARFQDRLTWRIDVAPDVRDARVPRLLLQPLVENAVEHGIARRRGPGRIEIAAAAHDGRLQLTVVDDGPGIAADARDGVGLSNTRARLALLYGAQHAFALQRSVHGGLQVSIEMPLRKESTR